MGAYDLLDDSGRFKAPFNQIHNEARVFTYKDTAVPTLNSDTPYSMLWLALRAEPMVLSVPAVDKKRYYAVQPIDSNTYNYGYIGDRATGNDAGDYLVAGPDWKGETPAGIKAVFRSETPFAPTAYRTQLFNPADMPNVIKVQPGYKVQPLSAYLHQAAPPVAPAIDFPKIDKRIGIGPGKAFNFKDLSAEHKVAVGLGMKDGEEKIAAAAASTGKDQTVGWWADSLVRLPTVV